MNLLLSENSPGPSDHNPRSDFPCVPTWPGSHSQPFKKIHLLPFSKSFPAFIFHDSLCLYFFLCAFSVSRLLSFVEETKQKQKTGYCLALYKYMLRNFTIASFRPVHHFTFIVGVSFTFPIVQPLSFLKSLVFPLSLLVLRSPQVFLTTPSVS